MGPLLFQDLRDSRSVAIIKWGDCKRTWTKARFNLLRYVFSFRAKVSSDATLTVAPTTKLRIPCRWPSGNVFHLVEINFSRICRPIYCSKVRKKHWIEKENPLLPAENWKFPEWSALLSMNLGSLQIEWGLVEPFVAREGWVYDAVDESDYWPQVRSWCKRPWQPCRRARHWSRQRNRVVPRKIWVTEIEEESIIHHKPPYGGRG